jgi:hypothetical protein
MSGRHTSERATLPDLYRASTIKQRRRSTRAELEQFDQQIIDVLQDDHPQSVRHVFYRMTDPRLPQPVEKSDKGYRHVQDRCVKMRRSGALPYHWIADMSRQGYFVNTFADAGDFLRRVNGFYRADLWRDADLRCEVWCESRSIASVIWHDCNELAVSLYSCGGFSSISFIHEAAMEHKASGDRRPLVVFYIGDYDPAGVLIDVSLEAELRRHLGGVIGLTFVRLGINAEQVEAFDLPRKPRKPGERRARHVAETVEAEAMPAHILRDMLRGAIESLLPRGALEAAKVAEASERGHIARMAELLGGSSS